jgi:hypothetical protein
MAPYREIRELAARIEAERGILEDVRLEPVPGPSPPAGRPGTPPPVDEVHARFRMTALELSGPSKRLVERALGAGGGAPRSASTPPAPLVRDPFTFVAARPPAAPGPPAPLRVDKPVLELKGIVSMPGGFLAIVNNSIVKVRDLIEGYTVERITERTVVVGRSGEVPRVLELPDLVPVTDMRR